MDLPVGGIEAHDLAAGRRWTPIAPSASDSLVPSVVHAIAGPATDRSIVFLANDMLAKRHELVRLRADGRREVIFQAEGDALWTHAAGRHLALSRDGRFAALAVRLRGVQNRSPDAYLFEGELEVWDLDEKRRVASVSDAFDDTVAWFPDGDRLACTRLVAPSVAREVRLRHVAASDAFAASTSEWEHAPVVYELTISTGAFRALHAGERPIVSTDGRRLLVRDFDLRWRILELDTDRSRAVEVAGAIHPGAIAFVDPHTVLYWSWPTEGESIEFTRNNSPLAGPKQMRALKLADLRDGRFQTVLPQVDPRRTVSYGL